MLLLCESEFCNAGIHCHRILSLDIRELLSAGRRLLALGEDVSSIDTTLKLTGVSLTKNFYPEQKLDPKSLGQNPAALDGSIRLAQGSAADLEYMNQSALSFNGDGGITQYESMRQDISSSKRKRVDTRSDSEHQTEYVPSGGIRKGQSRDQMPPPPIPMQQPIVSLAPVPSSDTHGLDFQHDHERETHFPRATVTPKQHPSQDRLSHSVLAHGSSRRPPNMSLAGNKTNNGQPHVAHRQFPQTNTGTAGPVYTRGGWQPPLESFDGERSGICGSPSSPLPSNGQAPVRRPLDHQQKSLIFPIEHEKHAINPSSRSTGSSLYRRRQVVPSTQFQVASPASSRNPNLSPNRQGRITLPRTPSFASRHSSDKGIGLSSHVRSSSLQTNPLAVNSSSHRQQLIIATPAHQSGLASSHFPTRLPAYDSSLPSRGGPNTEVPRHDISFDSGLPPMDCEMRSCFSPNDEIFFLARGARAAQDRDRVCLMEWHAPGPRRRANR